MKRCSGTLVSSPLRYGGRRLARSLTSAVLFSTRALNKVLLPTLGRPTMPVLSAIEMAVERKPRWVEGAAVQPTWRPATKPLVRARRLAVAVEAELAERATSLVQVPNAMADDMIVRSAS